MPNLEKKKEVEPLEEWCSFRIPVRIKKMMRALENDAYDLPHWLRNVVCPAVEAEYRRLMGTDHHHKRA